MIRATETGYKDLWFSPQYIFHRTQAIVARYGWRELYSNGQLKQEREAWISAMWALALWVIDKRQYWVEIIGTAEQTPDTKLHYLDQSTGKNENKIINIEVVDWEEHVDHPIQLIRKKCCARAYPNYFCLLVFGRNGEEKRIDLQTLREEVRVLANNPFGEIWIIGRTSASDYTTAKLYPDSCFVQVDVRAALQSDSRSYDIMQPQGRGTGTEVTPLGGVFIPLPRL